ncbi:MAG TPA: hypothetical protein VMD91_14330 [Candidatus Sulfotelmatobacter sp.]|nr:hypothetical protein [Candidatus Sulfotelmatobacter sp.]
MDFLNRAIDQAKQLQQLAADALQKTADQAQPLVADAVTRAQELQQTLVDQAPHVQAAAKQQYDAAVEHAGTFIETGKTVLAQGAQAARPHLETLADQAKKAADAAVNAVKNAQPKP